MKKVLFIAALAVISLASCKKDRTCTCTTTSTLVGSTTTTTIKDYPKSSKAAAKSDCALSTNALGRRQVWTTVTHTDAAGPIPAYTTTKECKLK